MKRLLILLGAIPMLLIGFSSCSQDGNTPIEPTGGEEVNISASITNFITNTQHDTTTRVSYDESGATCFDSGDQILVVNTTSADADISENRAIYTYNNGDWIASSGELLWERGFTNTFQAYYPATTEFTLPTDQSTPAKLAAADRMEVQVETNSGEIVSFGFEHRFVKVTFTTFFGSEFDISIDKITSLKVVTNDDIEVITCANGNSYTAIITPYWYRSADETFVKVYMNNDEEPLTVKAPADFVGEEGGGFLPGTHYTFSLKVGKDKVTIGQVTDNIDNPFGNGWDNDSETDLI